MSHHSIKRPLADRKKKHYFPSKYQAENPLPRWERKPYPSYHNSTTLSLHHELQNRRRRENQLKKSPTYLPTHPTPSLNSWVLRERTLPNRYDREIRLSRWVSKSPKDGSGVCSERRKVDLRAKKTDTDGRKRTRTVEGD